MLENLLQEADQAKSAGNYEKAVQIYQQAIQFCENDENQSAYLAICLQELAALYANHGLIKEAIPLYQKLIGIGEKVLGIGHPDVIATTLNLARSFEAQGQFAEADDIYKLATSKAEGAVGIAHPLAQETRQAYFDALANRQILEKDKTTHGLILNPASQTHSRTPVVSSQPDVRTEDGVQLRKYSNLKQSAKIKKLRYVAESVEEQAGNLLTPQNWRHHWRDAFYIVSVLLCIAAIMIALSKIFVPQEATDTNVIARRLIEKGIFRAVDDVNGINFIDNKYAVLTNDVHHRKIPYFLLKGGLHDVGEMLLSMAIRKENWYQLKQDELTTEDGNIYYANGAPELLLTKKMQALAEFARRYYAANGCYPDKSEKLKDEPGLAYINPYTNLPDLPVVKRLSATYSRDAIFPGVKVDASVNDCFAYLKQGGLWRDDIRGSAGKISAMALFTSQRCADGYKVTEFYIHGFDRNGNLITAGKPETYYAAGLYMGKNLLDTNKERQQEMERVSVHPPERIYVVPGDSVDLHFLRQCGSSLLTGCVVLSFIAWIFLESKKRRQEPNRAVQPIEVLFLISLLVWVGLQLIHLIP